MSTGRIVHTIDNSESDGTSPLILNIEDTNLKTFGVSFESDSNSDSSETKLVETFVKPVLVIPSPPTSSETNALLMPSAPSLSLVKSEPYPITNLSRIESPKVSECSEKKDDFMTSFVAHIAKVEDFTETVSAKLEERRKKLQELKDERTAYLSKDLGDLEYLNDSIPKLENIIKSQTSCAGYALRIDAGVYAGGILATIFGTLWGALEMSAPFSYLVVTSLGYSLIGLGRSKFGYPTIGQIIPASERSKISHTIRETELFAFVDDTTRLDTALTALKVKRDHIQSRLHFFTPPNAARNSEQSSEINPITTPAPR